MYLASKMECDSLLAIVGFLIALVGSTYGKLSPQECRKLGFSSNLLCGSCDDLKQFKLDNLIQNCQSCCEKDQAQNEGKVRTTFLVTKVRLTTNYLSAHGRLCIIYVSNFKMLIGPGLT